MIVQSIINLLSYNHLVYQNGSMAGFNAEAIQLCLRLVTRLLGLISPSDAANACKFS